MREAVEQGTSLPVCLSICVQRAALKAPPPFGRTLSFQDSAARLREVRTPAPRHAVVPFRRFYPVAEGVGLRVKPNRDGTIILSGSLDFTGVSQDQSDLTDSYE